MVSRWSLFLLVAKEFFPNSFSNKVCLQFVPYINVSCAIDGGLSIKTYKMRLTRDLRAPILLVQIKNKRVQFCCAIKKVTTWSKLIQFWKFENLKSFHSTGNPKNILDTKFSDFTNNYLLKTDSENLGLRVFEEQAWNDKF